MSSYMVETQDDWNKVAVDDSVSFDDTVIVTGDINAVDTQTNSLSVTLKGGARMIASSGADSWYTIHHGHLTLVWDGDDVGGVQSKTHDGSAAVVTLVGYPDDAEPYVSTVSTSAVRFERSERGSAHGAVASPLHYTWVGDAFARSGAPALSADLQSWDLLDAIFPDNPHLWNAGKYLTRFGRKGGASKRVEDLRKAVTYLERAIKAEERRAG